MLLVSDLNRFRGNGENTSPPRRNSSWCAVTPRATTIRNIRCRPFGPSASIPTSASTGSVPEERRRRSEGSNRNPQPATRNPATRRRVAPSRRGQPPRTTATTTQPATPPHDVVVRRRIAGNHAATSREERRREAAPPHNVVVRGRRRGNHAATPAGDDSFPRRTPPCCAVATRAIPPRPPATPPRGGK